MRLGDRTIFRRKTSARYYKAAGVRYADGQSAAVFVPKTWSDATLMTLASGVTPGADLPR